MPIAENRLRVEGSGGQHLHRIVRLELQRDMQVGGADEGGSPSLRRGGECIIECSFLISYSFYFLTSLEGSMKRENLIQEKFKQNMEDGLS